MKYSKPTEPIFESDLNQEIDDIIKKIDAVNYKNAGNLDSPEIEVRKSNKGRIEKEWIIKGKRDGKIYAWNLRKKKRREYIEIADYRSENSYSVSPLNTYFDNSTNRIDHKLLYSEICNTWRQLVGVRFKLLGFLPIVSLAIIVNLLKSDMEFIYKIFVCALGFFFTLGVRIYDKRNTELHDQLISRGRKIEAESSIDNGLFQGRKKSNNYLLGLIKIQHDVGLNIIYGFSLISWFILIGYFIISLTINGVTNN